MFKCGVVLVALLLTLTDATWHRSLEDSVGGLRAAGLGCRWAEDDSSGTSRARRTCYTAYQSEVGLRAQLSAPAAAATCQRVHDGRLATVPSEAVQNWLEEALTLKYVTASPSTRPLQLIGEFWFGAELVGMMARRQWGWNGVGSSSTLTFTNWHRGYPLSSTRHACAYMLPIRIQTTHDSSRDLQWLWKNDACYKAKHFICEHRERNQSSVVEQCGQPAIQPNVNLRIVNGVGAVPHSWPWMVSLQCRFTAAVTGEQELVHFCGGSLINDRWVLTAAHCNQYFEDCPHTQAVVGLHWMLQPRPDARDYTVRFEIFRRIPAPSHGSPNNNSNDVMLLELTHPVTFNDAVSPVCLADSTQTVGDQGRCYITGWGKRGYSGFESNVLRQVDVPIIESRVCNQRLWYNGMVDETMFCAGYEQGGRDACQGDSGGPLVCLDDGRWVQHGITSWGIGCGLPRKPGVYARVSMHRRWIEQTIRKTSNP